CSSDGLESLDQRRRGRVQEFIRDAVDVACSGGAKIAPSALLDHLLQRYAVTSTTPGHQDDVGVGVTYCHLIRLRSGCAEKPSAGRLDQFLYPHLRVDHGLAPFFAIDQGA